MDQLTHADRPNILIVEDDNDIALMMREHFEYALSADVTIANSADEAIELDCRDAEVVIVDYLLPDMDGVELVETLNASGKRPAILITGHATLGRAIAAMRCGTVDMFVKPFDLDSLTSAVADAVETYRKEQRRSRRIEKQRTLSKRLVKDRRTLRRKLDLVCKDLVQAYRDLALKVDRREEGSTPSDN